MKKGMIEKEFRHHENSSGVVGVVIGILALLSGIPGLLFGVIGFGFSLYQHKHGKNRWSTWGLVLNIVGFVIAAAFAYYIYSAFGNLSGLQGAV